MRIDRAMIQGNDSSMDMWSGWVDMSRVGKHAGARVHPHPTRKYVNYFIGVNGKVCTWRTHYYLQLFFLGFTFVYM